MAKKDTAPTKAAAAAAPVEGDNAANKAEADAAAAEKAAAKEAEAQRKAQERAAKAEAARAEKAAAALAAKEARTKEAAERKAKKEAERAEAKAKREAERQSQPIANDIRKPKDGTETGKVWAIATEISTQKGETAARSEVMDEGLKGGINPATIATQYARWRKFHGQTGITIRVAKPAPAPAPTAEGQPATA